MSQDNNSSFFKNIIGTVIALFDANREFEIESLLQASEITIEETSYDNWNGGITSYSIFLAISIEDFVPIQERQTIIETKIREKIELVLRPNEHIGVEQVYITPKQR